jgi:hypothetical protein
MVGRTSNWRDELGRWLKPTWFPNVAASDRPRRLLRYARRAAHQSTAKGGEDFLVSLVEGGRGRAGIVHGIAPLRLPARPRQQVSGTATAASV